MGLNSFVEWFNIISYKMLHACVNYKYLICIYTK